MPLMQPGVVPTPTAKPKPELNPIPTEAKVANVVDTKYVPMDTMLTHIEGQGWTVNYYSQVVSSDDNVGGQQAGENYLNQQYTKIFDFELKVQDPLSGETAPETQITTMTGSSILYPGTIPNTGDMFVADVGDGKAGIFEVTNTERLSMFTEACYRINYKLVSFLTDSLLTDLDTKVVNTWYFKKERIALKEDPKLSSKENEVYSVLETLLYRIKKRYFDEFYSNEFSTLMVPNPETTLYDPYVVKVIRTIVNSTEVSPNRFPEALQLTGDINTAVSTLWDMLIDVDPTLVHIAAIQMRRVRTVDFGLQPFHVSIAMSGIYETIYPALEVTHREKQSRVNVDALKVNHDNLVGDESGVVYGTPADTIYYPTDHDSHYVLSSKFYSGDVDSMSTVEWLLNNYLNGKDVDLTKLTDVANAYETMSAVDRFYYGVIIIILARVAIRDF